MQKKLKITFISIIFNLIINISPIIFYSYIHNVSTTEIFNEILSFYETNKYKGKIGIDYNKNKLLFFGNNIPFSNSFSNDCLHEIIIKDQNKNIIKEIKVFENDSIQKIIQKYNLENGVFFQENYELDIWTAEPKTIKWKTIENSVETIN